MDLIKIVNTSKDKDLNLQHDGKGHVTIEPGKYRILPLDYATLAFGNPGARNEGRNNVRDVEYANTRTRWGFYPGIFPEASWLGEGTTAEGETVGPFMPEFECYTIDDPEERVIMLIEDPTGDAVNPAISAASDDMVLTDRVTQLEAQLERALQLIAAETPDQQIAPSDSVSTRVRGTADPATAESNKADADEAESTSTAERNEAAVLPKPGAGTVKKDGPRTTRVGGT